MEDRGFPTGTVKGGVKMSGLLIPTHFSGITLWLAILFMAFCVNLYWRNGFFSKKKSLKTTGLNHLQIPSGSKGLSLELKCAPYH